MIYFYVDHDSEFIVVQKERLKEYMRAGGRLFRTNGKKVEALSGWDGWMPIWDAE